MVTLFAHLYQYLSNSPTYRLPSISCVFSMIIALFLAVFVYSSIAWVCVLIFFLKNCCASFLPCLFHFSTNAVTRVCISRGTSFAEDKPTDPLADRKAGRFGTIGESRGGDLGTQAGAGRGVAWANDDDEVRRSGGCVSSTHARLYPHACTWVLGCAYTSCNGRRRVVSTTHASINTCVALGICVHLR